MSLYPSFYLQGYKFLTTKLRCTKDLLLPNNRYIYETGKYTTK